MKRKFALTHVVVILLLAVIAVLAVCLLAPDDPKVPAPPPPAPEKAAAPAPVQGIPDALERALRRRIKQLEAELAAARAEPQARTNAPAVPEIHEMKPQANFRPPSPRAWLENLKKSDPKKYEEVRQRFAAMRQRRLERAQGRLEFLGSIDTAGMSKDERANHEKLQDLLAQRENLPDPADLTDEQMRESMRQRHELDRAIRQANETERKVLLRETANALGLGADDATALTETIQEVLQVTESDHGGPHGPPPQGGR